MTESPALQRSRHSDPEAFRQLVDRHQDVLFRTATLMTGSQSVAEARVREVLRTAWHGLSGRRACPGRALAHAHPRASGN